MTKLLCTAVFGMFLLATAHASAKSLPDQNPRITRAWAVDIGQGSASSVTIGSSQAFVFLRNGDLETRDLSTGALLSTVSIGVVPANRALFIDNRIAIAGTDGSMGLYSPDENRWVWRTSDLPIPCSPPVSGPACIVIGTGGNAPSIRAFDQNTGASIFNIALPEPALTAPVFSRGKFVVATTAGKIYLVDPLSDNVTHLYSSSGEFSGQKPVFHERNLLIAPTGYHRQLECLSTMQGTAPRQLWQLGFKRQNYTSTASVRDVLLLRPQMRDSLLPEALSRMAGFSKKQFNAERDFIATGAVHTSGWSVHDKLAAAVVREAGIPPQALYHIVAVDPLTGNTLARYSMLGEATPLRWNPEPIIAGRSVIASMGGNRIVSLNTEDSMLDWEMCFGGYAVSPLLKAGANRFLVQTSNDSLIAFDSPYLAAVPSQYALHNNSPNPFNSFTVIRYDLPKSSSISLRVLDARGRMITRLAGGKMHAGFHSIAWDGRDELGRKSPSGVYFADLQAGRFKQTIKMNRVK